MPWELEWTEHAVIVHVASPTPPVQDVLREIAERSVPGTHAVYLPVAVEGGSDDDQRFIRELWRAVTDSGRVARRITEVDDPAG